MPSIQGFSNNFGPEVATMLHHGSCGLVWALPSGALLRVGDFLLLIENHSKISHLESGSPEVIVQSLAGVELYWAEGRRDLNLENGFSTLISGVLGAPAVPDGFSANQSAVSGYTDGLTAWLSMGWVYAKGPTGAPIVLGASHGISSIMVVGKDTVIVGNEQDWVGASVERRPMVRFPQPVSRTFWPLALDKDLRWLISHPDGCWEVVCARTGSRLHRGTSTLAGFTGEQFDFELGVLSGGTSELTLDLRPYSVAYCDGFLGGPGGAIWDLDSGAMVRTAPFQYGVNVAYNGGFVSVDWESGVGFDIPTAHAPPRPVFVQLAEGDALQSGSFVDGHIKLESELGRCFTIPISPLSRPQCSLEEVRDQGPAVLLKLGAQCFVDRGGRTYGWNDEGLLVAVTGPPND